MPPSTALSEDHVSPLAKASVTSVSSRPAAFLDRDGVVNVDQGYTFRPEDLRFTPTAVDAVRLLNSFGYRVLIVTNQSGVARGLYDVADVERFHDQMQRELSVHKASIDAFYYCAYHPHGCVAEFTREHEDRKPNPGMLLRAMSEWNIRRAGSFLIGDRDSDMEAARRAGLPGVLVETNNCDLLATVRPLVAEQQKLGT